LVEQGAIKTSNDRIRALIRPSVKPVQQRQLEQRKVADGIVESGG
jgi:hypothetical protein